jgi:hypothetical protein
LPQLKPSWNKRNNDSNQISSQPPDPPLLCCLIEAKQAFHHSSPFPMNIDLVINRKTTADMMALRNKLIIFDNRRGFSLQTHHHPISFRRRKTAEFQLKHFQRLNAFA